MNSRHNCNYYNLVKQHVLWIKGAISLCRWTHIICFKKPVSLHPWTPLRCQWERGLNLAPRSDHTLPPAACSRSQKQQPARLGSKPESQSQISDIIQGVKRSWKPPGWLQEVGNIHGKLLQTQKETQKISIRSYQRWRRPISDPDMPTDEKARIWWIRVWESKVLGDLWLIAPWSLQEVHLTDVISEGNFYQFVPLLTARIYHF